MLPIPEFPRAVCFDLYGTLIDISIDTEPLRIWTTLSAELRSTGLLIDPRTLRTQYDKLVETEVREHGQPFILGRLFFFKLLSQAGHLPDRHAVRYFGRRFRALTTKSINLKPYASELLTLLRNNGCKLAIVSNTEEIVTSHDLDQFDMRRHFETVVLSSVVGVSKPDPRIFRIALQRLGVLAQECLFVGDDYDCDYRGPERVGLRPVLLCDKKCNHHSRAHCVRPAFREIVRAISNPTESACAVSASV